MCILMLFAKNDGLNSSFPIWIAFISFSCLIAVIRTFGHIWIKIVKGGSFIVPDLSKKVLDFLPFSIQYDVNWCLCVYIFLLYIILSISLLGSCFSIPSYFLFSSAVISVVPSPCSLILLNAQICCWFPLMNVSLQILYFLAPEFLLGFFL